jgi:hypothetical protein
MKFTTIKKTGASYFFNEETHTLYLEGTNTKQWKDVLAVALTPFKHPVYANREKIGYCAKGAYLQAKSVYEAIKDKIDEKRTLLIKGVSLGAYGVLLSTMVNKPVVVHTYGSWNCCNKDLALWIDRNHIVINKIYYRDIVPAIRFWKRPGIDMFIGLKKRWFLDYDLDLVNGVHSQYDWK